MGKKSQAEDIDSRVCLRPLYAVPINLTQYQYIDEM